MRTMTVMMEDGTMRKGGVMKNADKIMRIVRMTIQDNGMAEKDVVMRNMTFLII